MGGRGGLVDTNKEQPKRQEENLETVILEAEWKGIKGGEHDQLHHMLLTSQVDENWKLASEFSTQKLLRTLTKEVSREGQKMRS